MYALTPSVYLILWVPASQEKETQVIFKKADMTVYTRSTGTRRQLNGTVPT